jgi:NhaA family Na+:H+ antiporter
MSDHSLKVREHAWSGSHSRLARSVARPMVDFLQIEAASGLLLLTATAVALIWVNSPLGDSYHDLWHAEISIRFGDLLTLSEPLEAWVNDALMAIFFLVVGMEIKSELVVGDLRDPRVAALPAIAAVGGMVVPALIFTAFNLGGDASSGWGIPMATDIAFAVGVLTLLGKRAPARLKLFLLTLAIADDLGAIIVIALFYTSDLSFGWLGVAVGLLVVVEIMKRLKVRYTPMYVVVGAFVWLAMFESGVHATIAGVALGLMAPARPLLGPIALDSVRRIVSDDTNIGAPTPGLVRDAAWYARESVSVTSRMTALLSPWTSFVVVPLFALANAGIELTSDKVGDAATSPVTWGVILGLVVGKPLGITLFTWAASKSPIADLPPGLNMVHILGGGTVAGIGFTVALFVTRLAFDDPQFVDEAVMGILVASLVASLLGWVVLSLNRAPVPVDDDSVLDPHLGGGPVKVPS